MSNLQEMTEVQRIAKELDGVILNAFDVSKELEERAKQNNIVIAWGESDDLLELRGAVYDEIDAWEGVTVFLKKYVEIELVWNNDAKPLEPTWSFKTTHPHEKFKIFEEFKTREKELFCEGIVFFLDDINLL